MTTARAAADDRPRDRDRYERQDRERDPLAVVEPQAAAPLVAEDRGSPVLRDRDGGVSHAPAFLQAPTRRETPEDFRDAAAPRRRAPRSADGAASGPASSETEEA